MVKINHQEQILLHISNASMMGSITSETIGGAQRKGRWDGTPTEAIFTIIAAEDLRETWRNIVFETKSVEAESTVKVESRYRTVEKL